MRLTVHVADAKKERIEVKSKQDPKATVIKEVIKNTFSFSNVEHKDVDRILSEIETEGLGIPVKHYLSGDKIVGRPHKKIK
jgi:hypothetical protein